MSDKENYPPKTEMGGIGRNIFIKENEANIATTSRDISEMDRKEGNMDHGTKGGNFDQDEQEADQQDQNP
jgi:hypothetical protein